MAKPVECSEIVDFSIIKAHLSRPFSPNEWLLTASGRRWIGRLPQFGDQA
jgi:hypothetical protein